MTNIQRLFWASGLNDNRAKVIIATSAYKWQAFNTMRETLQWNRRTRNHFWYLYGRYLDTPTMEGIPLSNQGHKTITIGGHYVRTK